MAKKQTRRSISVSRTTYERLKAFCETNHISMSQLVRESFPKIEKLFEHKTFVTGVPSKSSAPFSTAEAARPRQARYGSSVAPSLARIADAALSATSPATARALSSGASNPAERRAFCSRARRATCSGVVATVTAGCASMKHLTSRRRNRAAKSSYARRQLWKACFAPRSPIICSRSANPTPGSSLSHPDEDPLLPCPTWAASRSVTLAPAAANAYAVTQPVIPPPMITTSAAEAPR